MLEYRQFSERTLDAQYRDLLARIMRTGKGAKTQQEESARRVFGHQMSFDLTNGFPLITERDISAIFPKALGELFAFLAGAHTQAHLSSYGVGWWDRWATPEKCRKRGLEPGDLGPGSYGAAWRAFPTKEGKPFDQVTHLLEQMKEFPHLRTHYMHPWIPQYVGRGAGKTQKVVVAPCHGFLHFLIDVDEGSLSLHHFQRSADVPVGLVSNLVQYGALTMMFAQVLGYRADTLVYTLSDAHIYESQLPYVEKLLATESERFPTVVLDPSVKDLFAFRASHFAVSDYHPKLVMKTIPTPV